MTMRARKRIAAGSSASSCFSFPTAEQGWLPAILSTRESVQGWITSTPAAAARASRSESRCSRPTARPQASRPSDGVGMSAARTVSPAYRPTRRISGPACASKDSATPNSSNNGQLVAETNSPHTLRRGNRFFSTTAIRHPALASRIAALAPAGPPPTTSASYARSLFTLARISLVAAAGRQKAMREKPGRVFVDVPEAILRPHRRELCIAESRVQAQYRIVARHGIATKQADEVAAQQRHRRAPWFAGDERRAAGGDPGKHPRERIGFEMVQEQIREDQVVRDGVRSVEPFEDVAGDHVQGPPECRETPSRFRSDEVLPVHNRGLNTGPLRGPSPGKAQQQGAVTRTELDDTAWRPSAGRHVDPAAKD